MPLSELLTVARGDLPADLVLRNTRFVNVFSGAIEEADLAIFDGRFAGIGSGYTGAQEIDLKGAHVAPGLVDAHVHIESSLCTPANFAAAVLPHGVTTVVTDPHEIANVAGLDGIRWMIDAARGLPLTVRVMASSCVPATHMETSGATLEADALAELLALPEILGLAEVMNFPGVVQGDPDVLAKLAAFSGCPIDGHLPALRGKALNAYVAAGIGSEHECFTVEEAAEKLARGLYILVREATNAHNLHTLLPLVTPQNSRRIAFCTDDRIPADLIDQGSIDYMVREAIHYGIDPVTAVQLGTLNACEWFGMRERGAIAPGRVADFIVLEDLEHFAIRQTWCGGTLIAEEDKMLAPASAAQTLPPSIRDTIHVKTGTVDLRVPAQGDTIRVIGSRDGQLITDHLKARATIVDEEVVANPAEDILKMAVVERHRATGGYQVGFIRGFGLQSGAIAGSIAHDHHNLVVIGADDRSMQRALRAIIEMGGGLAVAQGELILASLPLPVAGLMSDKPVALVRSGYDALIAAARGLGSPMHDPFMAMSFMALEVIPQLKLTDKGLVDVEQFTYVDLFAEG